MEDNQERKNELNPQNRLFCEYYVCGFKNEKGEKIKPWNGTKSYLESHPDSGYDAARSSASTLLTNPNIKQYIDIIQKDVLKLAGISRFSLVQDLVEIKEDAEQDKDKIKAIEVINKMTGLNEPEKQAIKVVDSFEEMTDEDIDKQLESFDVESD